MQHHAKLRLPLLLLLVTVLQDPRQQHVLVGHNATFFCSARDPYSLRITVVWLVKFSNSPTYDVVHDSEWPDVHIDNEQVQGTREHNSSLTIVISRSSKLIWDGAQFYCDFHGSRRFQSSTAILDIYTSFSKLRLSLCLLKIQQVLWFP